MVKFLKTIKAIANICMDTANAILEMVYKLKGKALAANDKAYIKEDERFVNNKMRIKEQAERAEVRLIEKSGQVIEKLEAKRLELELL